MPITSLMLSLFFSTTASSDKLPVQIDRKESKKHVKIGVASVNGVHGCSDDAVRLLREKGASMGGSKIRIISLSSAPNSSLWQGSAEVYR